MGLVAAMLSAAPARAEKESWDGDPFSASPKTLVKAAEKLPVEPGLDVAILLEEAHYQFDEHGRRTYTFHRIYRVLTRKGVADWGGLTTVWSPWYQERPEIRARVISPDGSVHQLDPANIVIAPARAGSDHVYDNRREVRAPFPAMAPGSVVSEHIEPKLPGLGSFDHAIVFVPGKHPVWIDPTDDLARAGELPESDGDRLALV